MHPDLRRGGVVVLRWVVCVVVAALLCLPWAIERAVESASFEDRLGTLPVQVGLAHNGYSTLDTGLLGKVYWQRTGPGGFGLTMRSTGPPLADGTLASYVSPAFVRANSSFLDDDPDGIATVYAGELRHQIVTTTATLAIVGGVVGGSFLAIGWSLIAGRRRRTQVTIAVVVVACGAAASSLVAVTQFRSWAGSEPIAEAYPLPGRPDFSFSSPQTREIAQQVQPFIEKNAIRIQERAARYEANAETSVREQLPALADALSPRDGEVVVLAEADPQGSLVGSRVRRDLYARLVDALPDGAVVLRTIAGDITSNGTVAEASFVEDEAAVSPGVPVLAAKGDHDTDITVDQLLDAGVTVPDSEVVEVGGLTVASARDPAFKALFGGLVVNESGVTEAEAGARLRDEVDAATDGEGPATYVVLHQPRSVDGYLGIDLDDVEQLTGSLTTPVDDGIPDLPPGIVTYGHLHDPAGPWVVWNTDGDEVTWTVITQLGTAGGVEENPTFNRFSTPFSTPLKPLSVQLQYVNPETGLQTGLVSITIATDGAVTFGDRVDVGLPGGLPGATVSADPTAAPMSARYDETYGHYDYLPFWAAGTRPSVPSPAAVVRPLDRRQ